jgi:hypothetical protein
MDGRAISFGPFRLLAAQRHCQLKQGWYASSVGGAVARAGKSFARL